MAEHVRVDPDGWIRVRRRFGLWWWSIESYGLVGVAGTGYRLPRLSADAALGAARARWDRLRG